MFIKDSNGNSFEYGGGNSYATSDMYMGTNQCMEPALIFPDSFRRMP